MPEDNPYGKREEVGNPYEMKAVNTQDKKTASSYVPSIVKNLSMVVKKKNKSSKQEVEKDVPELIYKHLVWEYEKQQEPYVGFVDNIVAFIKRLE